MGAFLKTADVPEIMTEDKVVDFLRNNKHSASELIHYLRENYGTFYFHFIDGDHWSERPSWKYEKKEDLDFSLRIYDGIDRKDCVIKYADEFIIIHPDEQSELIKSLVEHQDYTVTTSILKVCDDRSYETLINTAYELLKQTKKRVGRGGIHHFY